MKSTKSFVSVSIFVMGVIIMTLFPGSLFSATEDKYKPTPPPKIPAADFETEGRRYLDFTFLYADLDVGTMRGLGVGFNYVSMVRELGWNVGAGLFYLTGEDNDNTVDITGLIVPLTANIAFRPYHLEGGNSLIFFAGLHYSWMGIYADVKPDDEYDVSLLVYGPMFGAKARIMMGSSVAFIPYYVFKYENYDGEVNVNGTIYDVDIDPSGIHIFGFDIEIGAISIGAMLDMISNSNRDMIVISLTYNLDYDEGMRAEPAKIEEPAPKAPRRGRVGK